MELYLHSTIYVQAWCLSKHRGNFTFTLSRNLCFYIKIVADILTSNKASHPFCVVGMPFCSLKNKCHKVAYHRMLEVPVHQIIRSSLQHLEYTIEPVIQLFRICISLSDMFLCVLEETFLHFNWTLWAVAVGNCNMHNYHTNSYENSFFLFYLYTTCLNHKQL
jgi:hypothetical protein